MITYEKKGKSKHIVKITPRWSDIEMFKVRDWCSDMFGPGGRNKKYKWRYGWTAAISTFYFKDERDVLIFTMKWSGQC